MTHMHECHAYGGGYAYSSRYRILITPTVVARPRGMNLLAAEMMRNKACGDSKSTQFQPQARAPSVTNGFSNAVGPQAEQAIYGFCSRGRGLHEPARSRFSQHEEKPGKQG